MDQASTPPSDGVARPGRPERCRKRPSRALKDKLLAAQDHACFACGCPLLAVEYDHVIPLGLGGSNAEDNWAALCPACHKTKTREDLRAIARAKRRRRYQETGRGRAPRNGWNGREPAGGFDKTLLKRMNGWVEKKCECKNCMRGGNTPLP